MPVLFATQKDPTISPNTLLAVLRGSVMASIPMKRASASIGTWNCIRSTDIHIVETPGIPGAPKESRTMVRIRDPTLPPDSSTPKTFARNSVEMVRTMTNPSMFMVAPSGMEKEYSFGDILSRLSQVSMVNGIAALLDERAKAFNQAGIAFLRKTKGLLFVIKRIMMR